MSTVVLQLKKKDRFGYLCGGRFASSNSFNKQREAALWLMCGLFEMGKSCTKAQLSKASREVRPGLVKYARTYKSGVLPVSSTFRFPCTFPPCWEILYSNRRRLPPPDVRSRRTSRRDSSALQSDKPRWRLTKVVWLFLQHQKCGNMPVEVLEGCERQPVRQTLGTALIPKIELPLVDTQIPLMRVSPWIFNTFFPFCQFELKRALTNNNERRGGFFKIFF